MHKRIWLYIILGFGLGVSIGYYIRTWQLGEFDLLVQTILVVATGSGLSFGLVVEVIGVLRDYFKEKKDTRKRNNELIIENIETWMETSSFLMANLEYIRDHIVDRGSRDPDEQLQYYEETKKHLKAYNALSLWEKAKDYSDGLKDKGKKALEQFNNEINSKFDDLNLNRSDDPNCNGERPYCNLNYIREAVFTEVACRLKGKQYYARFLLGEKTKGWGLNWGDTVLARANYDIVESLKKQIEVLINNPEQQQRIKLYENVKAKMEENGYLKKFSEKLMNEIIKPFNMGILLKGKCRFC